MQVTFLYFAQVRQAAGVESEQVELPGAAELAPSLAELAKKRGEAFHAILFDESGTLRPSLIVLVNGQPVGRGDVRALADGDQISILSAVAGG